MRYLEVSPGAAAIVSSRQNADCGEAGHRWWHQLPTRSTARTSVEHLVHFVDDSKTLACMALVCPAWWRAARRAAGYRLRALAGLTDCQGQDGGEPAGGAGGERV